MPTQVLLDYIATLGNSNFTIDAVATLLQNVILDYSNLPEIGCRLLSDTTLGDTTTNTAIRSITIGFEELSYNATLTSHASKAASVTGNVDLTTLSYGSGGSVDAMTLLLSFGDNQTYSVTFNAPANDTALVAQINAVISGVGVASIQPATNFLVITATEVGADSSVTVIGGTWRFPNGVLTVLGLTQGTYRGANAQPFQGSIVSTSSQDSPKGTGVGTVQINFTDVNGKPGYETANLNGTTPVPLINATKISITSITPLTGTFAGEIAIMSSPISPSNVPFVKAGSGNLVGFVAKNSSGVIMSTSAADTSSVTVNYLDASAVAHSTTVTLNGTKPVSLVAVNISTITGITPTSHNVGELSVYLTDKTAPSGFIAAKLGASFYAYFPPSTDQTAPFWDLYTHTLAAGTQSKLAVASPVLS